VHAAEALARLRAAARPEERAGLARYGIPAERALGVAMRDMQAIAKAAGRDQALAAALWPEEFHETRMLALLVADPARLTRAEADAWAAAFDSWALADTAAFHLFDRTPFAWQAAPDWAADPREFVRRAGFALWWALALHDRAAPDAAFLDALARIEAAEPDPRPLVRKAAEMALNAIGRRPALNAAARAAASRLAAAPEPPRAWIGRTALKRLG
jgi:3-methyladenine DNA glycosylase AlkD